MLVTGASGFVGRALHTQLRSQSCVVRSALRTRALVETSADMPESESFLIGDLGAQTDWADALAGCSDVVHLAAHVHVLHRQSDDSADEFHRVNVEGSENLARQAARAGVRRFVYLSSIKVNGEASAEHAFLESYPVVPLDAYGASKAEAERRLRIIASETGMQVVIVRPPLVYGPGVKANFLSLLRAVDSGMPLPFSSISNLRSLVYVGNLVDALCACLTHPAAANRTFFVSDDHDVSTPQLIEEIAAALGKRARLFPMSPALLRGAGLLAGRGAQIARLTESLQVDISSIKTALNWEPPFSLRQGLEQTVAWYRSRRR